MTSTEKEELALFFDLTIDSFGSGFKTGNRTYNFTDDIIYEKSVPEKEENKEDSISLIADEIRNCSACPLFKTRKNAVPGTGVHNPLVLVIGRGPGSEEDEDGTAFTGITGERLEKMLGAIGLSRKTNCFVTDMIKCRTPNEREALPDETTACAAFLQRQILLLNPKIILCMGKSAAWSLLRTNEEMETLRIKNGKIRIQNIFIPVHVTYHPDDIWKNPDLKRPAWEDLKKLKQKIDGDNKT